MTGKSLAGLRAFVAEDEALVALLIEESLSEIGASMELVASGLDEAMQSIDSAEFDIAILDVNLRGQLTFPAADALLQLGIPFIFSTGYGTADFPARFRAVPILQKPFDLGDLERALLKARGESPS